MPELHTLLLGAEVDVAPHTDDVFQGTGIICTAWLLKPGPDPQLIPCYSVLFLNGAIGTIIGPDRLRVIKTTQLPSTTLLNRDADA